MANCPHASDISPTIFNWKTIPASTLFDDCHYKAITSGKRQKNHTRTEKGKVVIVGGSIAGICCAHALIAAGWEVVVLEKTTSALHGCSTGAGFGLYVVSLKLIPEWTKPTHLLQHITMPMTIEHEQAIDAETKITRTMTRDEDYNFTAAHWADLNSLLHKSLSLPEAVQWGHSFLPFSISENKSSEKMLTVATLLYANVFFHITNSGVLDYSDNQNSETVKALKKAYPDLGNCDYFDIGSEGHAILYELINKRINWIWYLNQQEPDFKGNSLTKKLSRDTIENMYEAAKKVWIPELVKLMRDTKEPFLNAIYDSEPLERLYWDNVVLVGDAAHPITPHGARATNMSVLDAAVLGKCLEKWGPENLGSALEEYQSIRLPVAGQQVLFSRKLGQIKQRFPISDRGLFDPMGASSEESKDLQLGGMPYFNDIPSILM